ncbi:MAG: hypothetical protein ABW032_03645 [Burkholderiaceae bacterium]
MYPCALRFAASVVVSLCLGGCALTKVTPGPTISETRFGAATAAATPEPGTSVLAHAELVFAANLSASAGAPDDSSKASQAYRSGLALLDMRCDVYLDALGSANQAAANEQKQVGIVGGFVSAAMGLAGSSAKAIAATAATFSFGGSSLDAFTTSFLFSDAAKSVVKLVQQSRSAYKAAVLDQATTLDYPGAVALLTGYEQICRPAQIRSLVDEAVAGAKVVAENPGALSSQSATTVLLGSLTGLLRVGVAEADGIVLYAWSTSDAAGRARLQANSKFLSDLVAKETAQKLDEELRPAFAPLALDGNPVAARWADAVAVLKADPALRVIPTKSALKTVGVPILGIQH